MGSGTAHRGQVLLYVLILLLLSAALGGALCAMWNVEINRRNAQKDDVQAYYLAMAGIEKAKKILGNSTSEWLNYAQSGEDFFALGGGNVTVNVTWVGQQRRDIVSTGRIRGSMRRVFLRVNNLTAGKINTTNGYAWLEQ